MIERTSGTNDSLSLRDKLLLTFGEVAELCSISKRSLSRAVRERELRVVQAPGTSGNRGKRIPLEEVEAWMERQSEQVAEVIKRIRGPRDLREDQES